MLNWLSKLWGKTPEPIESKMEQTIDEYHRKVEEEINSLETRCNALTKLLTALVMREDGEIILSKELLDAAYRPELDLFCEDMGKNLKLTILLAKNPIEEDTHE